MQCNGDLAAAPSSSIMMMLMMLVEVVKVGDTARCVK
jgi:hypothetical protein